ncbi:hypothetical protein [Paludibaculum fermentans]|uniref:Adenylate cyclase n=1 Tax=Paludibaculum fermentans TaxID=1473598 RepID=A0A7S7NSR1_PALFE|nr:hypothetical protein [Paludibaculum fermentans]QOY89133.1 hypothetical protein IRI77_04015 [Paludibaculum fermentans]
MAQKATPDPVPSSASSNAASPDAEVLFELRQVLESSEFAGSERGRTLLVYLVENALSGGLERLKERTIGIEIFGRDASYDTGQDAIVRVSANSVRKRLQAYYSRVPAASRVRIVLPAGTYVPEFQRVVEEPVDVPGPAEVPQGPTARPPNAFLSKMRLSFALVVLVLACAVLGYQNWKFRSAVAVSVRPDVLPWSGFAGRADAGIILTDANFTLHKSFSHREMTLAEYSSLDWLYELKAQAPAMLPLSGVPYTSVASAVTASRIAILLDRWGVTSFVRSARNMQVDDFKEDRPMILLGSAPSNPWVELIHDRLNFHVSVDVVRGMQLVLNRSPRQGEQASYVPTAQNQTAGVAYAVVALMPNLANKGPILLIAGTNANATQAAGEFLTDLPLLRSELAGRKILPGRKVQKMELLLRVDCMNSGASRSEVVAHRLTP